MSKGLGVLFVAIGFISLVGAGFFVYFLVNFSGFTSQLQANLQNVPALQGLSPVIVQNLVSTVNSVNNYVYILWIWTITLFVSSLVTMYYGLNEFKKKK